MVVVLLVALTALAYAPSFRGVYVFDDHHSIVHNPTLRDVTALGDVLNPGPGAGTVAGRPVANLSFAINYAISGQQTWSYHLINLLIHTSAGLVLFGLVRRTLLLPVFSPRISTAALPLAAVIALLWSLHPLQTEAVTYIVQRVESLAGLFYLLTLYGFVRAAEPEAPLSWSILAFVSCLLGMATKEVMVSAPLAVLLYDRLLLAGDWRDVWQRRGRLHLLLASTWMLLALLVLSSEGRGGSAGFGTDIGAGDYLLTQAWALPHYLRLVAWPAPLVFDYGTIVVTQAGRLVVPVLILALLTGATLWALRALSPIALPAALFFLILAPSSSIVPIATQTVAEHRMYLPSAAVLTLAVLGAHRLIGRGSWLVFVPLLPLYALLTFQRNQLYASEATLWQHTARHQPDNVRAHANLGLALLEAGDLDAAIASLQRARELDAEHAVVESNLAAAYNLRQQPDLGRPHAESAVRLDPDSPSARVNLANAARQLGDLATAQAQFEAALRLEPEAPETHVGLGEVLLESGQPTAAMRHLETGLRGAPDHPDAWLNLARAHLQLRQASAAYAAAQQALTLRSASPDAHYILGLAAATQEDLAEATTHFRRAVDLAPAFIPARNNLANALLLQGEVDEAIQHYEVILAARPDDRAVRENLAQARQWQQTRRSR